MQQLRIFIVIALLAPLSLFARTTPEEGSKLNYRIIGFSFPDKEQTRGYKLQIAAGNYSDEKAFAENIIVTETTKKNRVVAEVPAFGTQYTWRVVYNRPNETKSKLFHFSTMMSPDVDTAIMRMRITRASEQYKDNYIFVDCNKALYDMNGKPVWFFPGIENRSIENIHLRDFKMSPLGTITSIVNGRIFELSYSSDSILWQGPANSEINMNTTSADHGYHHEFTRMANEHYMVMGFEQPYWQMPHPPDSSVYQSFADKIKVENGQYYQKMIFGTVLEYDSKGNAVWKWSGADYFKNSDLRNRILPNGMIDVNDTHANAFYLDEKTKTMYISFRDINRIIQVSYPGKELLHTYGKLYAPVPGADRDRHLVNGFFCGQHGCRLSHDGNLYLFNNNICHRASMPTVLMLKQPPAGKDTIEKIWELECPVDSGADRARMGTFNFGGDVQELSDNALFVCMGGTCGKLFIVNRNKQILWSAQPEKWDSSTSQWMRDGATLDNNMKEGAYRASVISRAELESLVWGERVGK